MDDIQKKKKKAALLFKVDFEKVLRKWVISCACDAEYGFQ
jgi:hypothetical protein